MRKLIKRGERRVQDERLDGGHAVTQASVHEGGSGAHTMSPQDDGLDAGFDKMVDNGLDVMAFPHAERDVVSVAAAAAREVEREEGEAVRNGQREQDGGFDATGAIAVQVDDRWWGLRRTKRAEVTRVQMVGAGILNGEILPMGWRALDCEIAVAEVMP